MTTTEYRDQGFSGDENGVGQANLELTGGEIAYGGYAVPDATGGSGTWTSTMPETGTPPATLWPDEVSNQYPFLGSYNDGSNTYLYFAVPYGATGTARCWRIVSS